MKRKTYYKHGREAGIRMAANFIGQFDGQIDHPYRMEDCVLFKFNIRKSRPRKKLINRGEPG